jgi:DNA-binding LytR/AlgR family response regulator
MKKIRVLITDDEPGAHKVLENYIRRIPELELAGNCFNAIEAYSFLKDNSVDLILLDITMPEVNGFSFLKMLNRPPFVIFTTAHVEFAMESYDFNAVDYLKKPIRFERFTKAVNKLTEWIEKGMTIDPGKQSIDLKVNGVIRSIPLNSISYIQSLGNYVKIFLDKRFLVTQITTAELEDSLPKSSFVRIHKSYIVNSSKIEEIRDEDLLVRSNRLPIGKTFKKYVKEFMTARH